MLKLLIIAPAAGAANFLGAEVDFSNTITTGAIISSTIVIVIAGLFTIRGNVAKVWRENYEGEKEARELLQGQLTETTAKLQEATELIGELKKTIAQLEALPNLTQVVTIMAETNLKNDQRAEERLTQALELLRALFANHETRAEQRAQAFLDRTAEQHLELMTALKRHNGGTS